MRELAVRYKAEKVCHEEMVKMPLVDLKVLEVYMKSKKEYESHLKMNLELLKKEKCHVKPNKVEAKDDGWSYLRVVIARPSTIWERANVVVNAWSKERKKEAVARHGVHVSSIPDNEVNTDGQSERTFRTLENMFRACVRNLVVVGILTFCERTTKSSREIRKGLRKPKIVKRVKLILEMKLLGFSVGDHVMMKVSPWKGVVRFDKKGELAPSCYVAIRTFVWVSKVISSKIPIVKVGWNSKRNFELTWIWDDYLKDNGSCANEGTSVIPGVPDVPTYNSDDEQISWNSNDEDNDDEVNMSEDDDDQNDDNANNEGDDDKINTRTRLESDNDDDDFVHPKLSTFDEKERKDEEDKKRRVSSSVSSGFISNMLNPNPDTGIDFILNLNIESTSLVDVPVTTNVEMPPSSVTTLPPPPIPFIQPQQQIPVLTPTIVPSISLQNLPTFGSLFKFEDRVKALEDDFSEFKQTNQFAISDRLRDETQAKNADFNNTLDERMRKIIKKQVKDQVSKNLPKIEKLVNDQLEAKILTRSSNQAKTSYAIAANLSELELKKILIDKMENNKSIDRSIQQKTLYKALVDAYETDKDILETYEDTVTFKRRRDNKDEDEEPSARSNRGSKRRRAGKEPESTSAPKEKTPSSLKESKEGVQISLKSPTGKICSNQPVDETTQHHDWFQKPTKPPTPDRDWNKTFPAKHGPVQPSISTLAQNEDPRQVDTLTPELLAGPTYELMKGSCKSLVELEYFLEEVCKATTDQLDWNNPEGQQYPHDLCKPLPLIPNLRGRRIMDTSNGLKTSSQTECGVKEFVHDVYSRHRILAITKLKIVEWHNFKHLDWITVRRDEDKLYTFKEGDYNRLRLQDIEDMLPLLVQGKLTNLDVEERLALGVSL
ncbi:hypothetical protein Tco_1030873 [Tanacetum coccineum]|uniref:Reverse transcriptase domain-containing protein n=1 Tax=Tanacetum coccineum TaxID=301880 RepID=A0ABQ5G9Q3_9ASTR